ncbi:rCG29120 [Rattus norvegicus]|uniref:RCG29120 n=1 Tax=Rattus norvegicus TaxID=10116 RepID=A6HWM9_RAT|nr:rCG29120 [Rattus norvegicus]
MRKTDPAAYKFSGSCGLWHSRYSSSSWWTLMV